MAQQAAPQRRWTQGVVFADEVDRRSLARAAAAGRLVRLAPGVYTGNLADPPAVVARRHLYQILDRARPGLVLTDASARSGLPQEGRLLACSPQGHRDLHLPGLVVRVRRGPGPVEGDLPVLPGLAVHRAGPARGLLDNLATARGSAARVLPRADVERWLEDLLSAGDGPERVGRIRDQARGLAPQLRRRREVGVLDALVGALLGTRTSGLVSPTALLRAAGEPVDHDRLSAFEELAQWLAGQPPDLLADDPAVAGRRALLPFYEAYFSNYIEGTEFSLDEAADIALRGLARPDRPADAHDIAGTYELVNDPDEMRRLPRDAQDLLDLLQHRHQVLMRGRPGARPGAWKTRDNRAGSTVFVAAEAVPGTLRAGFGSYSALSDPFARAVFLMFFLSEVHPFVDGNGRVARVFMNAELVAARQVRVIVPTVYRNNYLAALREASRTGHHDAVHRTLAFARRFTARVDFSSRSAAEQDLVRAHALLDADEAERDGLRLQLP